LVEAEVNPHPPSDSQANRWAASPGLRLRTGSAAAGEATKYAAAFFYPFSHNHSLWIFVRRRSKSLSSKGESLP